MNILSKIRELLIRKDSFVAYSENISIIVGGDDKRPKTVKVEKYGIWDGKKVVLNDKEKTLVRNKKWLRKLTNKEVKEILINEKYHKIIKRY